MTDDAWDKWLDERIAEVQQIILDMEKRSERIKQVLR